MRWRLACDSCPAGAWWGETVTGFDAWCEACQLAQALDAAPGDASRCSRCGTRLFAAPRFIELWGMLGQLNAVLFAWAGDPAYLLAILPRRPVFLTDLTPPEARADDPAPLREQLLALAGGDWIAVLAASGAAGPRADAARAIAEERLDDPGAAIAAWDAVLAAGEDERARLARGSLLARAERRAEARADLERAGSSFAARWSRAALLVTEAVDTYPSAPDPALLARARAEAGEPSAYWSDPTVGRLLWWLLVMRTRAGGPRRPKDRECALLREAESHLEHDTFWDRALLLMGWALLWERKETARIGAPLARELVRSILAEPALAGAPLREMAQALSRSSDAIARASDDGDLNALDESQRVLLPVLTRKDLVRFRIPCARCGRGSIGIDEVHEAPTGEG